MGSGLSYLMPKQFCPLGSLSVMDLLESVWTSGKELQPGHAGSLTDVSGRGTT